MKIIKEGIKDRKNAMRIKCRCCEAELEITADDIKKEDIRRYFINCPCCDLELQLYEGSIPRNIIWKVDLRETK